MFGVYTEVLILSAHYLVQKCWNFEEYRLETYRYNFSSILRAIKRLSLQIMNRNTKVTIRFIANILFERDLPMSWLVSVFETTVSKFGDSVIVFLSSFPEDSFPFFVTRLSSHLWIELFSFLVIKTPLYYWPLTIFFYETRRNSKWTEESSRNLSARLCTHIKYL